MTDSIRGVSGTQGTSAGGSHGSGGFSGNHRKKGAGGAHGDLIEISQDARERSRGKEKKSILDFLKELLK